MTEASVTSRSMSIVCDDGVELSGTAVIPEREGVVPSVLLLSGSGPLDRDSNFPGQRLDISSTFAEALGAVGVASVRFDKRGVAESSGDFLSTGFDRETSDAAAAFEAMRSFDCIDPERLGVMGHSVGATIAARLATRSKRVAFAVLLGCATSSGAEVMAWQTDRIAEGLPGPSWTLGRRFRRKQAQLFLRIDATKGDVIRAGRQRIPARWMREYRAHEPIADLISVRCPVLAITGRKDIQVDPTETARLEGAVGGPCTTAIPSGLTHVLRATTREPSITRYGKLLEKPVDTDLVETVTAWIVNETNEAPE